LLLIADCWYWLRVLALVLAPATSASNQEQVTSVM
jgi:hypothetical protein